MPNAQAKISASWLTRLLGGCASSAGDAYQHEFQWSRLSCNRPPWQQGWSKWAIQTYCSCMHMTLLFNVSGFGGLLVGEFISHEGGAIPDFPHVIRSSRIRIRDAFKFGRQFCLDTLRNVFCAVLPPQLLAVLTCNRELVTLLRSFVDFL